MCSHAQDSGAAAHTTDGAVPSSRVADPKLFCVGALTLCVEEGRLFRKISSSERWQFPAAMAAPVPSERDVKALLLKHAEVIAKLRNSVTDVLKEADTELYDDVFLLRFCMSAVDAAHAEEALRKTLAWRKEKAALLQMDRGRKHMGHILGPSHPLVPGSHGNGIAGKARCGAATQL